MRFFRLMESKKYEALISAIIIISIIILYSINTWAIKPHCDEDRSFIEYIICNQVNDFLCPIALISILNLLTTITSRRVITSIIFYLILFIVSSLVWELLRPYILKLYNPFDKTPHTRAGDFIAYFLGYLVAYLVVYIRYRKEKSNL
ncbi:MAG: hypothetical protein K6G48_05740 [Acholeplasmatales bacterium]|nr:hypothetical protein [Acholeplasmatales bacterium]